MHAARKRPVATREVPAKNKPDRIGRNHMMQQIFHPPAKRAGKLVARGIIGAAAFVALLGVLLSAPTPARAVSNPTVAVCTNVGHCNCMGGRTVQRLRGPDCVAVADTGTCTPPPLRPSSGGSIAPPRRNYACCVCEPRPRCTSMRRTR